MENNATNFEENNEEIEEPLTYVFDDQIKMSILEDLDEAFKSHNEEVAGVESENLSTPEQLQLDILNQIDHMEEEKPTEPAMDLTPVVVETQRKKKKCKNEFEALFSSILDKDEEIIKTYKPDKTRTFISCGVVCVFALLAVMFCSIILAFSAQSGANENIVSSSLWVVFCFMILVVVVVALFYNMWHKNTIYALTNKRVIIRTGAIGVDFKSLDYYTIGAMDVNVSWVDRLFKNDTGTLSFGSMSSPIVNGKGGFNFKYISKPYEVYREIKDIVYSQKNK